MASSGFSEVGMSEGTFHQFIFFKKNFSVIMYAAQVVMPMFVMRADAKAKQLPVVARLHVGTITTRASLSDVEILQKLI